MPAHKLDNYLRSYRKRSGYSQEDLAYLLGAEGGARICNYERNGRQPSLDTALAYEAVFGVAPRDLFAGRFAKARTAVRRRAAFLRRRLLALPQNPATLRRLQSLAAISPTQLQ